MIILHLILHSAVHIYDFHIFITSSSSFHGFITNQFNYLLPVGSLAWLVERCTGIAEVKGSNPVQAWIFSGFLFATAKVASITAMISFHIINSCQTITRQSEQAKWANLARSVRAAVANQNIGFASTCQFLSVIFSLSSMQKLCYSSRIVVVTIYVQLTIVP